MMLKKQGSVTIKVSGESRTFEVWTQGRKGTLAPTSYYFKYKGRWITEFERRVRNWDIAIFDWLKIIYSGSPIRELVYENNPFLEMIPKNDGFNGNLYPVPLIWGVK